MRIISISRTVYTLTDEQGAVAGTLVYNDDSLKQAVISAGKKYSVSSQTDGMWISREDGSDRAVSVCRVNLGGTITLIINDRQYTFRKPFSWKLRFTLVDTQKEEIIGIIPSANWGIHAYNYTLQLNEEFAGETDSFIILQVLHCAVCSMSMLNGFIPPIVISSM